MSQTTLSWKYDGAGGDGFRIYRSASPMNPLSMPTPLASVAISEREYVDSTVVFGETYYYRVGAFQGSEEKISAEIEHTAEVSGDVYWSGVDTLLRFENNLQNEASGATWLFNGSAAVSTVQKKFGSRSLYVPNASSDIYTTSSPVARYRPFTMEAWVYLPSSLTNPLSLSPFFSQTDGGASKQQAFSYNAGTRTLYFSRQASVGSVVIITGTTVMTKDEWHHVAITFDGTTIRIFLDGNLEGSAANTDGWYPLGTLTVGSYRNSSYTTYGLYGYMDEVRITKNVARYTENFVPPSAEFPNF